MLDIIVTAGSSRHFQQIIEESVLIWVDWSLNRGLTMDNIDYRLDKCICNKMSRGTCELWHLRIRMHASDILKIFFFVFLFFFPFCTLPLFLFVDQNYSAQLLTISAAVDSFYRYRWRADDAHQTFAEPEQMVTLPNHTHTHEIYRKLIIIRIHRGRNYEKIHTRKITLPFPIWILLLSLRSSPGMDALVYSFRFLSISSLCFCWYRI